MARINIEEKWWHSIRRNKLIRLFKGDVRLADGLAIQAWRASQEFAHNQFLIPLSEFACIEDFKYLFDCDLAVLCTQEQGSIKEQDPKQCLDESKRCLDKTQAWFVYVKGSLAHHEWLMKNRKNASEGGKKSASRPRDSKGRLMKKPKQLPSELQAESNELQVSSSPSSSSSSSSSSSPSKKNNAGIRMEYSPEFDQFWKDYGRKGDKKLSYDVFKSLKITDVDFQTLKKAIEGYHRKQTDPKYRKDFENFLKMDWREYAVGGENGIHPKTQERMNTFETWKRELEARGKGGNHESEN